METMLNASDLWVERLEHWSQAFDRDLGIWSEWLSKMQVQFLRGDFATIADLCIAGEAATRGMTSRLDERKNLLSEARESGMIGGNLRDIVLRSTSPKAKRLAVQLSDISLRLHGVRQQSLALRITACQSQLYTEDILRILSTGEADSATYSPAEASCGGGRLIDQAA